MLRFVKTALLATVVVGGLWALAHREQIQNPSQLLSLVRQKIVVAPVSYSRPVEPSIPIPLVSEPVVRVASFKLHAFGTTMKDTDQLPLLTDICRQYDAISLQGIEGRDDVWLQLLADSLKSTDGSADYYFITDQTAGNRAATQNAILFNRRTLELENLNWYTVNDPDNLLRRKPLVGWFRTKLPDTSAAFTFTLVNVEMAAERPDLELAYLGELFRAIRNDGRGEDDVILAGDFNAGDRGLEPVQQRVGLTWVVSNTPTDVRRSGQFDNLVFSPTATVEFTGRGGVLDFMRKYNLRLSEAETISNRLPVWAEFSVFEGGRSNAEPGMRNAELGTGKPYYRN